MLADEMKMQEKIEKVNFLRKERLNEIIRDSIDEFLILNIDEILIKHGIVFSENTLCIPTYKEYSKFADIEQYFIERFFEIDMMIKTNYPELVDICVSNSFKVKELSINLNSIPTLNAHIYRFLIDYFYEKLSEKVDYEIYVKPSLYKSSDIGLSLFFGKK